MKRGEETANAGAARRARDLGLKLPGEPGPLNAITDVADVAVGLKTITVDVSWTARGMMRSVPA